VSKTPILDLEQPPSEPSDVAQLSKPAQLLAGAIPGSAVSVVLLLLKHDMLPRWNWPGFNVLLVLPALYACIAIHELGHLALVE